MMRRSIYITPLFLACIVLLTFGCCKTEQLEKPKLAITYDVISAKESTKAASPFPETEKFVSWARFLEKDKTWAQDRASSIPYIDKSIISYDNASNCWKNSDMTHYWPKQGSLTFFAASPETISNHISISTENGLEISDYDVNSQKDIDIMVADIAADKKANDTSIGNWKKGVSTIFRHKLAKVAGFEFNLHKDYSNGHDGTSGNAYTSGDMVFIIKEIKINNIIQSGSFASGTNPTSIGNWTADKSTTPCSYTWYSNGNGTQVKYDSDTFTAIRGNLEYIYILPQQLDKTTSNPDWNNTPNIEVKYVKRTYSRSWYYPYNTTYSDETITTHASLYDVFANGRILINRQITFRITINLDANLIYWAPDQKDWTTGEFDINT